MSYKIPCFALILFLPPLTTFCQPYFAPKILTGKNQLCKSASYYHAVETLASVGLRTHAEHSELTDVKYKETELSHHGHTDIRTRGPQIPLPRSLWAGKMPDCAAGQLTPRCRETWNCTRFEVSEQPCRRQPRIARPGVTGGGWRRIGHRWSHPQSRPITPLPGLSLSSPSPAVHSPHSPPHLDRPTPGAQSTRSLSAPRRT